MWDISSNNFNLIPQSQAPDFQAMLIVWTLLFFFKPFNWIKYNDFEEMTLTMVVDKIALLDMPLLMFFIGYTNERNKEVVLVHKKIALNYLKTYFVPDFLANMTNNICYLAGAGAKTLFFVDAFEELVRLARLYSYTRYIDSATNFFKTRETAYEILCIVVVFSCMLHYSACSLFLAATVSKTVWNENSWVDQANYTADTPIYVKYVQSVLEASSLLYMSGIGHYDANVVEQVFKTIILLVGWIFISYLMVKIFAIMNLSHSDETKYAYIIEELEEFMIGKRLPEDLRKKLLSYYEYNFDKSYFSEKAIMSTLSEHLKYEIKLYNCKNIINNVEIFDGLPRAILARLIACMKDEIILANEVIYRAGDVANYMYFISEGTVAVYNTKGNELFHLKDQHSFGELAIIMKRSRSVSVVSVENTHLYVLSAADLQSVLYPHPEIYGRLVDRAHVRYNLLKEKRGTLVENKDLVDILDGDS